VMPVVHKGMYLIILCIVSTESILSYFIEIKCLVCSLDMAFYGNK